MRKKDFTTNVVRPLQRQRLSLQHSAFVNKVMSYTGFDRCGGMPDRQPFAAGHARRGSSTSSGWRRNHGWAWVRKMGFRVTTEFSSCAEFAAPIAAIRVERSAVHPRRTSDSPRYVPKLYVPLGLWKFGMSFLAKCASCRPSRCNLPFALRSKRPAAVNLYFSPSGAVAI